MERSDRVDGWADAWEGEDSQVLVFEYILEKNGIPSKWARSSHDDSQFTRLLVREEQLLPATALIVRARKDRAADIVATQDELRAWLDEARQYLKSKRFSSTERKSGDDKTAELLESVSAIEAGELPTVQPAFMFHLDSDIPAETPGFVAMDLLARMFTKRGRSNK